MARTQNQGGGGQQNQLFGTAWMQKFCGIEWLEFCDKSDAHVEAADLAARESAQDVRKELSQTGHGIVTAVNACKTHADQLEASGQIDSAVGSDLKGLLDKLKERALADKKSRDKEKTAKDKKSKAATAGETTKFHLALTCLIRIEREPMEAWLNNLPPAERMQFIKAIAAMSPEQASRAIRDIAGCMTDIERGNRARANNLIGQQEESILALALQDLAGADQALAESVEQRLDELHAYDVDQHTHLVTQFSLFDERDELVAILKTLASANDLTVFLQRCRNRNLVR